MSNHMYKMIEIVGSSAESIELAIQNGVEHVSKSAQITWCEVGEIHARLEKGKISAYQVKLKVATTLE